MAEILGSASYISWIWGSGTLDFTPDFRTATDSPTIEMIDATAGTDLAKTYIPGFKDASFGVTCLAQAGSLAAWGTLCQEGHIGTIVYGAEGTAASKTKVTIPAYSMGYTTNLQYAGLTEIAVTFQQNGNRTYGTF